ncbi:hypothetical protein RND71_008403 [Anisodus tanguticus]|uniref:Mur ligase central domain-containing protein n=1 Tax=Anisodus tanguticus TaxID=243964 RepID=A0AAE1SLQ1_9SOLA|nr:hypothetical protein RND71_008403 [Anisodus tanguticus]
MFSSILKRVLYHCVELQIVGLGKLGSAATKLAFARGASVITVDQNENLGSIFKLNGWLDEKDGDLKTIFGNFDNKYLKESDIVVVSYGVPLQNYGLISIISSGKQILSELDFAAQVIPTCTKIIDVTGTNGKSTVATFAGQVVVVEVSSYQLEIPLKYFCPSVVVILNLTPDHLEQHQTMWNYAAIKCQIFSHMRGNKIGILPLVGKHNYTNAAVAALLVIGLDIEIKAAALSSTISKLRTLPHRMQVDSDELVDDSKATNVEATYSGLIGFEQKSVLLLGCLAKEVKMKAYHGFEQLVEPLRHHRGVITLGYSGKMIQNTLCANGLTIPCLNAKSLKNAVTLARSMEERALSTASFLTETNAGTELLTEVL